jgi:hypothetical protein
MNRAAYQPVQKQPRTQDKEPSLENLVLDDPVRIMHKHSKQRAGEPDPGCGN